ncbi:hypothetical protein ACN47E_005192 [Coniothyrium glycines]
MSASSLFAVECRKLLPFWQLEWQEQEEILSALPAAMQYGYIKHNQAKVWVYLCKTTPTIIFHSCHDDGEPIEYLLIDDLFGDTVPSYPFELATSPMEVLALATYYFICKDLVHDYQLDLSDQLISSLRAMCQRNPGVEAANLTSKVIILRLSPAALAAITSTFDQAHFDSTFKTLNGSLITSMNTAGVPPPPSLSTSSVRDLQLWFDRLQDLDNEEGQIQSQLNMCGVQIANHRDKLDELHEQIELISTRGRLLMESLGRIEAKRERLHKVLELEDA